METDFKKGEFNLVQVIKLTMIAIGGTIIAGSLIKIIFQLAEIIKIIK